MPKQLKSNVAYKPDSDILNDNNSTQVSLSSLTTTVMLIIRQQE